MIGYCFNAYSSGSLEGLRRNILEYLGYIRSFLSLERFGLGLWFSEGLVEELRGRELEGFRVFLEESGVFVYTLNGFPQREFHGSYVKEGVYFPTWQERERLEYSKGLAEILAYLLPEGFSYGSVSTLPLHFKGVEVEIELEVEHIFELVEYLFFLEERLGRRIVFCFEPEPGAYLERTEEVLSWFNFLVDRVGRLASRLGVGRSRAEELLRRYVGVCWDACHQAVEFEEAAWSLGTLESCGILVGKVQISSGLEVRDIRSNLVWLREYGEDAYLHQVIGRDREGKLHYARDLPLVLDRPEWWEMEVCRIHFHVPIFLESFFGASTTHFFWQEALEYFVRRGGLEEVHWEVETYTWKGILGRSPSLSSCISEGIVREMVYFYDSLTFWRDRVQKEEGGIYGEA